LIIDTDVLIWYLKGNEKAKKVIVEHLPFDISVVTYMELVQGMRDKAELRLLLRQLQLWSVRILHIDTNISGRAMFYVEELFLSHAVQLADALIAASAVEHGEPLLTANDKHYRHVPNLQLKVFRA
jgi:predicted nucleic acid-binding protein